MDEAPETVLREVDALPEEDDRRRIVRVLEEEVRKAKREQPAPPGRWARLVGRPAAESRPAGQSEDLLRGVREFREGFAMGRLEKED